MTSCEIAISLREKKRQPRSHTLWMAAIFNLYRKGYNRRHIASAFHVHPDTVSYSCDKIRGLMDINDKITMDSMEILKTHIIDIFPYFEKTGATYSIKTYVKIDNIRL